MIKKIKITFLSVLFFSAFSVTANAQKLPNIQKNSIFAPTSIKIDGKSTEWGNKFQAYNHATDIFYTVSNDNSNLYLTVQATDPVIINKIIGGGITLTVIRPGKKNDKDGVSITYPIFNKKNRPYVHSSQLMGNSILTVSGNDVTIMPRNNPGPAADSREFQGDSIMRIHNKRLADNSKYIGVSGVMGLDSLISVYNNDGIKAAELFDNKIAYTYELAIDLRHLGLSINSPAKFDYHITINASSLFSLPDVATFTSNNADATTKTSAPESGGNLKAVSFLGQSASTDFWGEYTLVKK